jgi:hypothetical protein
LAGIVGKYKDKDPLYLLFGDFNLCLEDAVDEDILQGWEAFPKKGQRTGRGRRAVPIDYVLIRQPETFGYIIPSPEAFEFSVVPLIEREDSYELPISPELCSTTPVTKKEDISHDQSGDLSLAGFSPSLTFVLTLEDEFEIKKHYLINDTHVTFDHDFLFFRTFVPHGVLSRNSCFY